MGFGFPFGPGAVECGAITSARDLRTSSRAGREPVVPDIRLGLVDAWVEALGISRAAAELYASSQVVDLHIDSFIWTRLFGYDLRRRHSAGPLGRAFLGQADFPRAVEAGLTGATWVITTNPWRPAHSRAAAFRRNFRRLTSMVATFPQMQWVRTASDYRQARSQGKHGVFIGVQGGNAADADFEALQSQGPLGILRVTLLHLSSSPLGVTSSPVRWHDHGLTRRGREYVEYLRDHRIFLDLAHINRKGFFDALEVHGREHPVLVTHTGVSAVHPSWRNLEDDQLRAIAQTGGLIGIMFHSEFLGDRMFGGQAERIVDHIDHVIRILGEDFVALGSDFDGAIVPPRDLPSCSELPRLAELMLRRGYQPERIQKVLGGNFLRVLEAFRP